MYRKFKKIAFSILSFLGIGFLFWSVLLLNPTLSYAHSTALDNITIYHNEPLPEAVESILSDAIQLVKASPLYSAEEQIDICLNDGSYYPQLWIYQGGLAYAFYNKVVMNHSEPDFSENRAYYTWEVNNNETRKVDLTWLIAHEITHTMQSRWDRLFPLKYDFWKIEGYAEYISRGWQGDGQIKEKLEVLIVAKEKEQTGIPIISLSDGTIQSVSYFEYALAVQYLLEVKGLSIDQLYEDQTKLDAVYEELKEWTESQK